MLVRSLWGTPLIDTSIGELVSQMQSVKRGALLSLNPEILMAIRQDRSFESLFQRSWNIPDGIGVCLAMKWIHNISIKRLTGIDLLTALLEKGGRFFLWGGAPEVLSSTLKKIQIQYPKVELIGAAHGFQSVIEQEKTVEQLRAQSWQYLLIAQGFPRQEQILLRYPELAQKGWVMTVGGCFDILSGHKKRAPVWMQHLGLEWFFRLIQEPWRFKRQFSLLKFFWRVIRKKN